MRRVSSFFGSDSGGRTVERSLFLVALGLVMAGLAGALFLTSGTDDADGVDETVPGLEDAGSDADADAEIGPSAGTVLAPYIEDRFAALAEADGERVAIVSFAEYLTETDAETVLSGSEIGVLMVAFPSGEPTSTSDLDTTRAELVAEAQEQLPELRSILPTVNDQEFIDFYTAEIERYEQILASGNIPEVVYGAIVRAEADVLRSVAENDLVRLVDIGDSDVVRHGAALSGIRPEESTVAGDPTRRPVASM